MTAIVVYQSLNLRNLHEDPESLSHIYQIQSYIGESSRQRKTIKNDLQILP